MSTQPTAVVTLDEEQQQSLIEDELHQLLCPGDLNRDCDMYLQPGYDKTGRRDAHIEAYRKLATELLAKYGFVTLRDIVNEMYIGRPT